MACAAGCIVLLPDGTFVFVKRRDVIDLHAEDVSLDVVRQCLELIGRMGVRGNRED